MIFSNPGSCQAFSKAFPIVCRQPGSAGILPVPLELNQLRVSRQDARAPRLCPCLLLNPKLSKLEPEPPPRESQVNRRAREIVLIAEQRLGDQLALENCSRLLQFQPLSSNRQAPEAVAIRSRIIAAG